jgi:hypothetical protein
VAQVTNLLEIFFCFSNFTSLHHVLLSNKIGDLTMRVIDLELRRYDLRIREEKGKKPSQKFAQFLSKQERLLYVAKPWNGKRKCNGSLPN